MTRAPSINRQRRVASAVKVGRPYRQGRKKKEENEMKTTIDGTEPGGKQWSVHSYGNGNTRKITK